jgi:hypothetical protein
MDVKFNFFFIFLEKLNQRKKHDAKVTKTLEEHKPFNYREMIVYNSNNFFF